MSVRALSVVPGKPETAGVTDRADPSPDEGAMLVQGLLVGVCGTDIEIIQEGYGWVPPGQDRLVLGHESLGQVIDAPAGSGFAPGDLVAGIVRRPDPLPCEPCGDGSMGLLSQRQVHRARHQGTQRVRGEPVACRARVRRQARLRGWVTAAS